jgi:hypothetical protein
VREIGNVLRSTDVKEFPEMVKHIRREGIRARKEASGVTQLLRDQRRELRRAKRTIRTRDQEDRTCFETVSRLFRPDREVQTKARLYDELMSDSEEEDIDRVKGIVKKYAARVEEALVEFRALAAEVLTRCSTAPEPEAVETSHRDGRAHLSGSELQGNFRMSDNAPQEGELDRLMGGRLPTPDRSSRMMGGMEPVQAVEPGEASLTGFLNLDGEMAETDAQ